MADPIKYETAEQKKIREDAEKARIENIEKMFQQLRSKQYMEMKYLHSKLSQANKFIQSVVNEMTTLKLLVVTGIQNEETGMEELIAFSDKIQSISTAQLGNLDIKTLKKDLNELLNYCEKYGYALRSLLLTVNQAAGRDKNLSRAINDAIEELVKIRSAIEKFEQQLKEEIQREIDEKKDEVESLGVVHWTRPGSWGKAARKKSLNLK